MDDALRAKLAEFRAEMTRQERKRWRPLYLTMKREERRLRVDCKELHDRDARAAAKAQYTLIKELLALAPHQWTAAERRRITISTGEKEMPPGIIRVDGTRVGKKR